MKILQHITQKAINRFWSNVTITPGCWQWQAWTDRNGYGSVNVRFPGKNYGCKAHRFSWVIHNNQDWPDPLIGRHLCNNPSCVNPDHIKPGTQQENMDDAVAIGSIKKSARKALGKRIMTPKGEFNTIIEAREALHIPRSTMDKYLKEGNRGYYRI